MLNISGTIHHMIVIYGDYRCKMIISAVAVFIFFFQNFDFCVVKWVKGQKMVQNDKKICCAQYLSNHTSYDCHLLCKCVK